MVGILLTIVFITGYLAIVMEHKIRVNKAATALVAGSLAWTIFIVFSAEKEKVTETIGTHMTDTLYPTDHFFWEFLAYATGKGGSILIIGSAAGVAAMGMERITFFWFLKRISLLALSGYLTGAITYILMF